MMKIVLDLYEKNDIFLVVEGTVELDIYPTGIGNVPYLHIKAENGEDLYVNLSELKRAIKCLDTQEESGDD
jgi:hypothetical protein